MFDILNYFSVVYNSYTLGFNILTFNVLNVLKEYCVKTDLLIALVCLAIISTLLFWTIGKAIVINRISDLNRQLTEQIDAKVKVEKLLEKLQAELENKVLKRTAALGLANQDLKESVTLMEKVADLTPNILYVYDLEKKYNIYANRFIGEIFGYTREEVDEMNLQLFDRLIHPEDLDLVAQHHQKCLTLRQDEYLEIEYRMKDRFGQWHWLHSKDTVFERNQVGKPTQILGITQDISETKKIQAEAVKLNQQLAEQISTLELWHKVRIELGKMNEFLQACLTIDEAKLVLSDLLPILFPHTHGAVYLMNNSKNLLNAIAVWGLSHSDNNFEPNECWSLRRSNPHLVKSAASGLSCTHVRHPNSWTPTLCQPMIAKGKTLGMLYLRFDALATVNESVRELAETVAQNIAMSVANLTLQEELRYQSLRDPLTGLFNRRYLQESLAKEIERARRKQNFIGVMMLDIDYFKRFNDTYGHSAGDRILQKVASYLISEIRQYDIACRYGGEELILVMPDASIEDIVVRAEEIRLGVNKLRLEHKGQNLGSICISIGVSCFPDDGVNTDDLINAADKALYQAKKEGRNCVKRC